MNAFFDSIVNHTITNLVGMVLFHFLWQAIFVAVAVAATTKLQKRCASQTRYLTLLAGLCIMTAIPLVTFVVLSRNVEHYEPVVASLNTADLEVSQSFDMNSVTPTLTIEPANSIRSDGDTIDQDSSVAGEVGAEQNATFFSFSSLQVLLPWLVALWSGGVVILALRLILGFNRIRTWRHAATEISMPKLIEMREQLCQRMRLKKPIRLLESVHAASPVVIGWIRPAVLIPASTIAGLTPREMEAILVHELAHIHRHDYLVNMLQAIIETVLFYHPAVWWLSNCIREERENCCDDIAIKICNDRQTFVYALARLEEIRCRDFQVTVAANGGTLVKRMRRILGHQQPRQQSVWPAGMIALASVVFLVGTLLVSGDELASANLGKTEIAPALPDAGSADFLVKPTVANHFVETVDENYETQKGEIKKLDSKTGIEQSLVSNVILSSGDPATTQVSLEMKFTNLLSYSLIPARVAKELAAVEVGEIDFGESNPNRQIIQNEFVFKSKETPEKIEELVKSTIRSRTAFVNEVAEFDSNVKIVPYPNSPVWFPGHLGTYGMNQLKQHVFKVVRIEKVDLGIGPTFGPINALVLDDGNSDFGLLSRDWFQGPQGKNGERLMFFAAGTAFKFLPPPNRPNSNAIANVNVSENPLEALDEEPDQQRVAQPGVTVLNSHTYNQKQRKSERWVDMEKSEPSLLSGGNSRLRVAVDQGVAHNDKIIYLTLSGQVVAAAAESGKGKWLIPWRKMAPIWKTVSVVELDLNGTTKIAVELFSPRLRKSPPIYRYYDFETGELIDFVAPEKDEQGWGPAPELGNLRLRLKLNGLELEEGQPVLASLEIKNFGDEEAFYDPQNFFPFRIIKVKHGNDEPAQFLASLSQTMGGPKPLQPGESQVLWENTDIGSLYMFDQGEFKIQAIDDASLKIQSIPKMHVNRLKRVMAMPVSNVVTLKVAAGEQAPIKRFLKSLMAVAPDKWKVTHNSYGITISTSPTGEGRDRVSISLGFEPEPIPADQNPYGRINLGKTELGTLYLSSNKPATKLWPNHIAEVRDASSSIK